MIFDVGIETAQPNQIKRVIAIPTYYESATVPKLIAELVKEKVKAIICMGTDNKKIIDFFK